MDTQVLNNQIRKDLTFYFQGAFDRQTSMKATSALFSIALLTSSTLIFNLDVNIQVEDIGSILGAKSLWQAFLDITIAPLT